MDKRDDELGEFVLDMLARASTREPAGVPGEHERLFYEVQWIYLCHPDPPELVSHTNGINGGVAAVPEFVRVALDEAVGLIRVTAANSHTFENCGYGAFERESEARGFLAALKSSATTYLVEQPSGDGRYVCLELAVVGEHALESAAGRLMGRRLDGVELSVDRNGRIQSPERPMLC